MTAIQKLNLSPRALALTLLATLVVLIAATWFILVSPKHSQVSDLKSQIDSAQTQLLVRKHAAQAHKQVVSEAARARRALPDSVAMPQVVLQLSRVASEEHVSVDSITPAAATPFAGYDEVPLTVVISGKFFDVQGFLRELRNQVRLGSGNIFATGRLFDVQGVNISQGTPAPLISASLTMNTFFYTDLPLATVPTTPPAS